LAILCLSAWLVAKYERHIDSFRRSARLRHVAAFFRTIYDDEAILFDISLYHGILRVRLTFPAAVERARMALETIQEGPRAEESDPARRMVQLIVIRQSPIRADSTKQECEPARGQSWARAEARASQRGGKMTEAFTCLPDTVDPRGKAGGR
jgi:hypothetical protein